VSQINTTGFYRVLKERMEFKGMDIKTLAKGAGMRAAAIEAVFEGRRKLTADELMRLCDVLSMDLNDFRRGLGGGDAS
jgi:transcriptional regulator with XRE-family HTH domain